MKLISLLIFSLFVSFTEASNPCSGLFEVSRARVSLIDVLNELNLKETQLPKLQHTLKHAFINRYLFNRSPLDLAKNFLNQYGVLFEEKSLNTVEINFKKLGASEKDIFLKTINKFKKEDRGNKVFLFFRQEFYSAIERMKSKSIEKPSIIKIAFYDEDNKYLEFIEILKDNDIFFKKGEKELFIMPSENSYLGELAKVIKEKWGAKLLYNPDITPQRNAAYHEGSNSIYLNVNKNNARFLNRDLFEEIVLAFNSHKMRTGEGSLFHGFFRKRIETSVNHSSSLEVIYNSHTAIPFAVMHAYILGNAFIDYTSIDLKSKRIMDYFSQTARFLLKKRPYDVDKIEITDFKFKEKRMQIKTLSKSLNIEIEHVISLPIDKEGYSFFKENIDNFLFLKQFHETLNNIIQVRYQKWIDINSAFRKTGKAFNKVISKVISKEQIALINRILLELEEEYLKERLVLFQKFLEEIDFQKKLKQFAKKQKKEASDLNAVVLNSR